VKNHNAHPTSSAPERRFSRSSMIRTMSVSDHSVFETPAAIAGVWPADGVFSPSRARGSACRRGHGVLRTGKAAPHLRLVKSEWLRRRGLSLLIQGDAAGFSVVCTNRPLAGSSTSHAVSGQRAACEPSFAHPTMQSPQKSLAPDEPKYLLSRARGDKYPSHPCA
jgi:hypothetical protein